jgi:hypothetical protein
MIIYGGYSPQQLQNSQHDIIHVTKSTRLTLLGMMQPPTPIHRDIRCADIQLSRRCETCPSILLTKVEEAAECWAVIVSYTVRVDLGVGW